VKQSFDRDRALSRRFQKIDVLEPSESETLDILKGLRPHYELHHGVRYTDEALEASVSLSARHLQDLHLPDKAIDVIDEAGAAQKLLPLEQRLGKIGPEQIEQIVAKMARVPVQAVSADDKRALQALDVELKRVIFGQRRRHW
jgi:ATP-dependent Clp protease ATP-binding subunit ClpA